MKTLKKPPLFPLRGLGGFSFGFALALLLLVGCKKDDPAPTPPKSPLPPETQTGANTFGCYINGAPWTPVSDQWQVPRLHASYDVDKTLTISATRNNQNEATTILLFSEYLLATGTYSLEKNKGQAVKFSDNNKGFFAFNYHTDVEATGSLTVTKLDPQAGIVSGRFEFTLKKQGHPEIKVTEGRFDCKM